MAEKKLVVATLITLLMLFTYPAEALEWKSLHERADEVSVEEAELARNENPESVDALYVLGLKYLMNHRNEEAEKVFQEILTIAPDTAEAQWGLGEVLKCAHDLENSEKIFKEVIEQSPDFAPAYISMGHIKYLQRSFNQSVRYTGKVITLGRDDVDMRNLVYAHGLYSAARGMLAYYAGPFSKTVNGFSSLRHLNIVRILDDESFIYYFGWGSFYSLAPKMFGGDLSRAEEFFQKAIDLDPLLPDTYVRLAQVYRKMGKMDKYEALLDKALSLDPQSELALDVKKRKCEFICLDAVE